MTMTNTNQRLDELITESERLYPIIDQKLDGEQRAKQILRLGMQVIARHVEVDAVAAGNNLITYLDQELFTSPKVIFSPAFPWDHTIDALTTAYGNIERGTLAADGTKETDASHIVHLTGLALPYAAEHYPHLDQAKIAIYCWIHDIVEAYAGDVPSLGMTPEQEAKKHKDEQAALERITRELQANYPHLVHLILSYENLSDAEAKFVKSFDKLDPGFTHFANRGLALRKHHAIASPATLIEKHDQTTKRMLPYAGDFPLVLEDRQTLLDRIIDVTDWHSTTN